LFQAAGRYEDALTAVEEVIERFGRDPLPKRPYMLLDALLSKSFFLNKLGRRSDAIEVYGEFVEHYRDDSDPYVRAKLAMVMSANAEQLLRAGRYEEVVTAADELLASFGEAKDLELRNHVAEGLCNKADALGKLGRWEAALSVDEQVIESFDDAPTGGAWPLSHKAVALSELGQLEQATRAQLISTLYSKASVLSSLEREAEALDVLRELITRFEDDDDPRIQITVSGARTALDEIIDNRRP
jgi:tetratricopeptide (TPR) repeat protein